jgi:UDP-N-acetyl-D-galactosamine dehydrogenase
MGNDTVPGLKATGSKWNFYPFVPGLSAATVLVLTPTISLTKPSDWMQPRNYVDWASPQNGSVSAYVVAQLIKTTTKMRFRIEGAKGKGTYVQKELSRSAEYACRR